MKKIRFNIYGLLLFLIIMIPNIIWFIVPAKNDILRIESITPLIDNIAGILQGMMILCLCFINKKQENKYGLSSIVCVALYFISWILYYCSIANIAIILAMCVFPCLAFIFYEIKTRNWLALIPTLIFSVLHLVHGILNFGLR